MLTIDISDFIQQHQLPESYQHLVDHWFAELAQAIAAHQKSAKQPLIIGINGAQGSGKSTLAALLVFLLERQYQLKALSLSLDDFYLTRAERLQLADSIHPLLATRGVPGTHNIALACHTIHALKQRQPVTIPRFNKASDDRYPPAEQPHIDQDIDIIVLEGWCLGSEPQTENELVVPINDLESNEDKDRHWRLYVNKQLAENYPRLFALIDLWIMLKAPSFDCVFNWRLEQEHKLRQSQSLHKDQESKQIMDDETVARFIKFYQRITTHTLKTLPAKVNYLYELDADRHITRMLTPLPAIPPSEGQSQWLIFTDLDGSLLDHYSYRYDAAKPMLTQLEKNRIPVIPVSSKTKAELELIRNTLHNAHPFIVENGAAVYIPVGYFDKQPDDTLQTDSFWVKDFVAPRAHWQALIKQLKPAYDDQFITFAEAGIDGIIAMTGLNVHAAARAARRQYGEPVCWRGNGNSKQQFIAELQQHGAHVLEGGRFLHVSGDCNKGMALDWLANLYRQANSKTGVTTVAIGDSRNDSAMLEQADFALLIRSPVHPLPELQRDNKLYVSASSGPEGWARSVSEILAANHPFLSPDFNRGNHG